MKNNLLGINPKTYVDLPESEIRKFFGQCDAVWLHDGNPSSPHAELTSGLCSNGFFDCLQVLSYPNLAEILAYQLIRQLKQKKVQNIDWVVGSAYASITFSYEVAKILRVRHGFVEKDPADPKKMVWSRFQIPVGSRVLQIEELITTLGTTREVRRTIQEGNDKEVVFLPVVGAIVHRPPQLPVDYGDITVVSLIEQEVWAVSQEECPLCKAGSLRYKPKTHWAELTGKK